MNITDKQIFEEIKNLSIKVNCEDNHEVKAIALSYNENASDEAKRIHKEAIIIDTCTFNLEENNWALEASGATGLNCTVPGIKDSAEGAMQKIIDYYQVVKDCDKFMMVYKADDIIEAKRQNKIGIIIGSQTCEFVHHNDIYSSVEVFAKVGLRIMPIAYNHSSFAADGCYAISNGGITNDGKKLIRAMEKSGVTVDLSHVGERSSLEALHYCTKIPVFSHSNPKTLYNHPRNISDELAKKCASLGGVVGVCAYAPILWDGQNFPTIDNFVDCIIYYADLIGIDHVGIGIDSNAQPGAYPHRDNTYFANLNQNFSGKNGIFYKGYMAGRGYRSYFVDGIVSLANFVNIVEHMLKRGFKENEIKKVLGENWLRVFRETWN